MDVLVKVTKLGGSKQGKFVWLAVAAAVTLKTEIGKVDVDVHPMLSVIVKEMV